MNEQPLFERSSRPTTKDTPALTAAEINQFLTELDDWQVADNKLRRRYKFADFAAALAFVNKIGEVAERENHHPDIAFGWGYAELTIWTHDVGGLSENDFILAAKINRI